MRVKATISFSGAVTMAVGEERDIPEGAVLSDLLSCGYVVSDETEVPEENDETEVPEENDETEVPEKQKKAVKADGTKHGKG